jgi:hypothetical protein
MSRFPQTHVLVVSALPKDVMFQNGNGAFQGEYLEKPFTIDQLLSSVKHAFNPKIRAASQ